jgi:hypothetical protein
VGDAGSRPRAEHISAAAGRLVRAVQVGRDDIRDALLADGFSAEAAEYGSELHMAAPPGAMAVVTDDFTKVTGRPATTFAEFAKDAAHAWR